ncbi:MAG: hypothetical protein JW803_05740 [Endomicrobiales bacterium]|nr:hypothetical protein [Endomicrobiales bacterium]
MVARFIVLLSLAFFLVDAARAHPAKSIEVGVDGDEISVSVTHQVKDPAKHYIGEIKVMLNGKEIVSQKYGLQGSAGKQEALYVVPGLKDGDKIKIWTNCIKFGTTEKEIIFQTEEETEKEAEE